MAATCAGVLGLGAVFADLQAMPFGVLPQALHQIPFILSCLAHARKVSLAPCVRLSRIDQHCQGTRIYFMVSANLLRDRAPTRSSTFVKGHLDHPAAQHSSSAAHEHVPLLHLAEPE